MQQQQFIFCPLHQDIRNTTKLFAQPYKHCFLENDYLKVKEKEEKKKHLLRNTGRKESSSTEHKSLKIIFLRRCHCKGNASKQQKTEQRYDSLLKGSQLFCVLDNYPAWQTHYHGDKGMGKAWKSLSVTLSHYIKHFWDISQFSDHSSLFQ